VHDVHDLSPSKGVLIFDEIEKFVERHFFSLRIVGLARPAINAALEQVWLLDDIFPFPNSMPLNLYRVQSFEVYLSSL